MSVEKKLSKYDTYCIYAYPHFDMVKEMNNILKEGTPPNEYGQMLLNKRRKHNKKH
jgi:hypothetical protein